MNRNVMIVLAGGFLIAVLVALLVQASLSGGKPAPEPVVLQEEPKVQIVVAAKDLPIGAELSEENMKWQDWPKNIALPGAFMRENDKKTSEVLQGRLRRAVKEGEPIVESALVPDTEGNFLAASLREGMRAFSIKASPSSMVSGFVAPGDFVDVILTYRGTVTFPNMNGSDVAEAMARNLNNTASETILQNVKVLAVDQAAMRDEEEPGAKLGKTVTLEVDYKGAEILALASQIGTLDLSLRRLGDENIQPKPPVTTDARITSIYEDLLNEIMDPNDNNAGNSSQIVRIYRGDSFEEIFVSP